MQDTNNLIVEQIPHLRRYARALLRDAAAADDLVQDCLTRALSRIHLWTPGSDMRRWLFSILHNLFVNQARRGSIRPDNTPLSGERDNHAAAPRQEHAVAVRDLERALAELPEEQRCTVLLVGLEGLTYAEVAEITDAPVGTVMSRLSRGRERLRELMDRNGGGTVLRRIK